MDFRYVFSSQTMRIYAESFIELDTISILKTKGFFCNSLVSHLCVLEQTLKVVSRTQTGGRYLATAELPVSGTIKSKVLQTESVQWNHRRRFGRRDIVLPNLWSIHRSQKSWGLLFRGLVPSYFLLMQIEHDVILISAFLATIKAQITVSFSHKQLLWWLENENGMQGWNEHISLNTCNNLQGRVNI